MTVPTDEEDEDITLEYWRHFPKLRIVENLDLSESQETVDEFIKFAAANPHLQQLKFSRKRNAVFDLHNNFARLLEATPNLRGITLNFLDISDKAVPAILSLKHLRMIALYSTNLTASGIKQLLEGGMIEDLFIGGSNFDEEVFGRALAASKKPLALRKLCITNLLPMEFFGHLNQALKEGRLPLLSFLALNITYITSEVATLLQQYKGKLECIESAVLHIIDEKSTITRLDLGKISLALRNNLPDNHSVVQMNIFDLNYRIPPFMRFKSLEKLSICEVKIYADQLFQSLSSPAFLPNLKYLNLKGVIICNSTDSVISTLHQQRNKPFVLKLGVEDTTQSQLDMVLTSEYLKTLQISSDQVTNLDKVKDCKSLRTLRLLTVNADLSVLSCCFHLQKLSFALVHTSAKNSAQVTELFERCSHRMNVSLH